MDTITRQIAEYASSLAFSDLDTATVQADEDVGEKFAALARPVIGQTRSADTLARWWRVAEAPDLRPLIRQLDLNP